eukprot:scaffold28579_cov50-Attheya_sp.AAC.2
MATFIKLDEVSVERITDACISCFFNCVGLPRIIFVDADSKFQGIFKSTFERLRITVDAVSQENHKAIRNENFRRYLNKIERNNTADTGSLWIWKQGVLFCIYAWNASPVDGTDIPRSQVAIGREFPFPIDLTEPTVRTFPTQGQQALDHFEAVSPLLFRQRQMLDLLNSERRQRHTDLRNQTARGRTFALGDLVIVRKQVKSVAANNFSAKLVFKTRGLYRVIEQINPNSYRLQKLPFLEGLGRPGRFVKESAVRMTVIPSTLIFHKMADGADARIGLMEGPLVENALEKWLGVVRRGAYVKAQDDPEWAFEPLASMRTDELPATTDDDMDDGNDRGDDDGTDDGDHGAGSPSRHVSPPRRIRPL